MRIAILTLVCGISISACSAGKLLNPAGKENSGPLIERVTPSSKGFSIDCVPTSMMITAVIEDSVSLKEVDLFHRIENEQSFRKVMMNASGGVYTATVKASDLPIGAHGIWEYYVLATDVQGQQTRSPLDRSVQLLLCLGG